MRSAPVGAKNLRHPIMCESACFTQDTWYSDRMKRLADYAALGNLSISGQALAVSVRKHTVSLYGGSALKVQA